MDGLKAPGSPDQINLTLACNRGTLEIESAWVQLQTTRHVHMAFISLADSLTGLVQPKSVKCEVCIRLYYCICTWHKQKMS